MKTSKRTLIWVLGAASAGGLAVFLSSRKTELADPITPDSVQVATPTGYRRVKSAEVTPPLTDIAREVLAAYGKSPLGTQVPFQFFTADMMAVIEEHYHEPGGPLKPWGKHKGVSLFVKMGQQIPTSV